jgi:hypothetical protein
MREQKLWYVLVVAVEEHSVFLMGIRHGDTLPEDEIEIPKRKFIRMFGRDALHEGQLGTLALKMKDNGNSSLRGWPYRRRWTAEDIAEADTRAELLFESMRAE